MTGNACKNQEKSTGITSYRLPDMYQGRWRYSGRSGIRVMSDEAELPDLLFFLISYCVSI